MTLINQLYGALYITDRPAGGIPRGCGVMPNAIEIGCSEGFRLAGIVWGSSCTMSLWTTNEFID
jgi:hypothetical protein